MHRHYGLDIYLDLQRVKLLDLNIRELCTKFILVKELKNITSSLGVVIENEWLCYEWTSWIEVEKYLEKNVKNYTKVRYVNNGNIFKTFDSCSYADEFLPGDGKDFVYLEHLSKSVSDKLTVRQFYNFDFSYGAKK